MLTFGPVPSRRLGKSLGINNIIPKYCSYSCIYCQVGRTLKYAVERQSFYSPEEIYKDVITSIKESKDKSKKIDYLTFVSDGEPTLDINLKKTLKMIDKFGIKTAIISNSSLIWMKDVQKDLLDFDWVSLKCDSVDEKNWKKIDRPHGSLDLKKILNGITDFSNLFRGDLNIEIMLIKGFNDSPSHFIKLRSFLEKVNYHKIYLSIPTRPPVEKNAIKPDETTINIAYNILSEKLHDVQLNIGFEGNEFASTGDLSDDILKITAVHPMRIDSVITLINKENESLSIIEKLKEENKIKEVIYNEEKFIVRVLNNR